MPMWTSPSLSGPAGSRNAIGDRHQTVPLTADRTVSTPNEAAVEIVSIGTTTLRLRLAGPFVVDEMHAATRRLRQVSALGFDVVEVDTTAVSMVDHAGRDVLDDFTRCVALLGGRLEAFDPGRRLDARAA